MSEENQSPNSSDVVVPNPTSEEAESSLPADETEAAGETLSRAAKSAQFEVVDESVDSQQALTDNTALGAKAAAKKPPNH